jgi:hypothetical protein
MRNEAVEHFGSEGYQVGFVYPKYNGRRPYEFWLELKCIHCGQCHEVDYKGAMDSWECQCDQRDVSAILNQALSEAYCFYAMEYGDRVISIDGEQVTTECQYCLGHLTRYSRTLMNKRKGRLQYPKHYCASRQTARANSILDGMGYAASIYRKGREGLWTVDWCCNECKWYQTTGLDNIDNNGVNCRNKSCSNSAKGGYDISKECLFYVIKAKSSVDGRVLKKIGITQTSVKQRNRGNDRQVAEHYSTICVAPGFDAQQIEKGWVLECKKEFRLEHGREWFQSDACPKRLTALLVRYLKRNKIEFYFVKKP